MTYMWFDRLDLRRLIRFLTALLREAVQLCRDFALRNVRGVKFYELCSELDDNGRGTLTEQEIVQRLGPPDGMVQSGTTRALFYYWDRFGNRDWWAAPSFNNGVLVHFAYNDVRMQTLRLQPYPQTQPAQAQSPATTPGD